MLTLDEYHIDGLTGFLQRLPTTIPKLLQPFNNLLGKYNDPLDASELRREIKTLPYIDWRDLNSHEELLLGHKILSFLASRYVWQDGDEGVLEELPEAIARPLMYISIELGCQPLLGHIDLVLSNCFPLEPICGFEGQRNKYLIQCMPSNEVNWIPFIERTADIEITFSIAPKKIIEAFDLMRNPNTQDLISCLKEFAKMLEKMRFQIKMLWDELDPKAFYCEMRRFLSGWSHGKLRNGIIYEGVPDTILTGMECNGLQGDTSPRGRIYQGASAGQSIVLQALDAFFQIEHYPDIDKFFVDIRQYMIREHRKFIEDVKNQTRLRSYVKNSCCDELKRQYNECIIGLANFRESHLDIVGRFILSPARQYATTVEKLKTQGTGGQALAHFLEKILLRTKSATIELQ